MGHIEEFYRRCEEKKQRGMVDIKFVVTRSRKATPESFCEGANSIDEALERGDWKAFKFNDGKRECRQNPKTYSHPANVHKKRPEGRC